MSRLTTFLRRNALYLPTSGADMRKDPEFSGAFDNDFEIGDRLTVNEQTVVVGYGGDIDLGVDIARDFNVERETLRVLYDARFNRSANRRYLGVDFCERRNLRLNA